MRSILILGTAKVAKVEFHVFSSARPTSADIESFLGELFRKILFYLNKGARTVSKEAGINVIEDVENNKPLKEAVKSQLAESRSNLKRKAKEKNKFPDEGIRI